MFSGFKSLQQVVLGGDGGRLPVNDVVLVAVVDAGKDLLHQNGSVSFGELSTLEDLVEQLSSFADPRG